MIEWAWLSSMNVHGRMKRMTKEKGRVTLLDIAKATGFTVNTVSRALKNKDDISRETCLHIQQVARDLYYADYRSCNVSDHHANDVIVDCLRELMLGEFEPTQRDSISAEESIVTAEDAVDYVA